MSRTAPFLVLLLALGLAGPLPAQDGQDKKEEGGGGMPVAKGKGKVTDAINMKKGAIFDIGSGITMTFPVGLPVGESRLVTLKKSRRLPGKLIHKRWRPVGPALDFNGAFNTGGSPIVLAVRYKRNPVKRGMRLVVAMEVGTFCEGPNKRHKLGKTGLCSGFRLHDAEYDAAGKRMVARLESTGGMRMQFGLVPEASEDDPE